MQKICNIVALILLLLWGIWGWQRATKVGISWDEPYQRAYGEVVYHYLFFEDPSLHKDSERLYGPVVPFLFTLAEKAFDIDSDRDAYILRHRLTWLIFLSGCGAFFLLASAVFSDRLWGLVAMGILLFSPSVASHGFFNTKDIPFMVGLIITAYCLWKSYHTAKTRWLIATSLTLGMTTDIRIISVIYLPIVLGVVWFWSGSERFLFIRKHVVVKGILCLSVYCLTLYVFWPTLWTAPLSRFWEAWSTMKAYPWEGTVTYLGFRQLATQLPWHYLPVYMVISTPLFYLYGMAMGLVALCLRAPMWRLVGSIVILWSLYPMTLIIGGSAVVYDSWRHVLFVYPGLVLLATYGFYCLACYVKPSAKNTWVHVLLVGLPLSYTWVHITRYMHTEAPLSYIYTNVLAGPKATLNNRFETDYWGLSYREGLEWVLAHDTRDTIRVWMPHFPGQQSLPLLTCTEQARLQTTAQPTDANYIISTFRLISFFPDLPLVYEKQVDGVPVLRVYQVFQ